MLNREKQYKEEWGVSANHIRANWQFRKYRALILGVGTEEFINQCKAEFEVGQKLVSRRRDPEVSKANLEALRDGSLNFEVTYAT